MTSAELKHHAKQQEWAAQIQNCRSSGLPVRAWLLGAVKIYAQNCLQAPAE